MDGCAGAGEAVDAAETHVNVRKSCTCVHTLRATSDPHGHRGRLIQNTIRICPNISELGPSFLGKIIGKILGKILRKVIKKIIDKLVGKHLENPYENAEEHPMDYPQGNPQENNMKHLWGNRNKIP